VEYSSPNTNKPLHLGHLRNNFLGHSIANILEAEGHEVFKVQIINDRGIHICKSMLAWEKYGEGETPDSSGLKGDHLVGKYYVIFDQKYKEEINRLMMQGKEEDTAKKEAPLMKEAQQMLKKWEDGDAEVRALWEKMNGWVYDGFASTYQRMGVDFDKLYYESDTFLIGKEKVLEHEQKGLMYRKEDGSLWVDLSAEGLDY
jgi:arginyl-tRNA synthetase